jgi:hypothetical protein
MAQAEWPPPKQMHWIAWHALADEVRACVRAAFALMDKIDRDCDLCALFSVPWSQKAPCNLRGY